MKSEAKANRCQLNSAYTLIELVIVIVLVGLMAGAASALITHSIYSARTQYAVSHNNDKALFAMTRMRRELYRLSGHASSLLTMAATQIRFIDVDGRTISYQLSGHNLVRNGNLLADNIRSLNFGYYNAQGKVSKRGSAVRYINIAITAVEESAAVNFSTTVFLRNRAG